jgi:ABC-2 type transport system permease protein
VTTATLLQPRLLAARNVVRRHPLRTIVLTLGVALLWAACLVGATHVVRYFHGIGDFGPALTQRLLVLLFGVFFAVLALSATIAALQTFYLASDVSLLLATPAGFRRLHHARFVETLVASSWMLVVFGLPVFLAYGLVYRAGAPYYAALVAVLGAFVVIPTALGVLAATALVLVFPARGARDTLAVGVGFLVAGAVILVRMLDPERLAHPSGLLGFAGFLASFESTGSPYSPTTWAAQTLVPLLAGGAGTPAFELALLVSTAAMLVAVSAAIVERVYLKAWSKAQVGRVRAGESERPLGRWLARLATPLPRLVRLLVVKDLTVFVRDASQWSQLLLLAAVVGIYVYNFRALPIDGDGDLAERMRSIAIVLNLGLGAFVTTAVAVRFVFPMVSLEGRAWWILRTAPVPLRRIWQTKFWMGFLPLALFAAGLVVVTDRMLRVPPLPATIIAGLLVALVAAIVAMGLAFGAAHPKLDTANAAQIATGFGAMLYMAAALALTIVVMALAAWPIGLLLWSARLGFVPSRLETAGVAAGVGLAAAASLTALAVARRRGIAALARLGE